MLHCNAGRFYVGHTDDLDRRMAQHETAERKLKGWSRAKKLALIRGDWDEIGRLARNREGQKEVQAFDKLRLSGDLDG